MLLIHDDRGFLMNTADSLLPSVTARNNIKGKILYPDPSYVGDSTVCNTADALGDNIYSCLSVTQSGASSFKMYSSVWSDIEEASGDVNVGPIVVKRLHPYSASDTQRFYASYEGVLDPCPDILPTNRFPLLLASGFYQKIVPTGQLPNSWYLRWDNPNEDESALIDIFVDNSLVYNVFVGSSSDGKFMHVPVIYTSPNLTSVAGTNSRLTQQSLLVTLRGGSKSLYMFRVVPVIQVTLTLRMSVAQFFSNTFAANVALMLGISSSRIKIAQVKAAATATRLRRLDSYDSTEVIFTISPNNTIAADTTESKLQYQDLTNVTTTLTVASQSGVLVATMSTTFNASVSSLLYIAPTAPIVVSETNATASAPTTVVSVSLLGPTASPSFNPFTATPSASHSPSASSTLTPTIVPTCEPTSTPTFVPSTNDPSKTQSPSTAASLMPTNSPIIGTIPPTTRPPSQSPSGLPTTLPTNVPTILQTETPMQTPTSAPTATIAILPTLSPSIIGAISTAVPSLHPTKPSAVVSSAGGLGMTNIIIISAGAIFAVMASICAWYVYHRRFSAEKMASVYPTYSSSRYAIDPR